MLGFLGQYAMSLERRVEECVNEGIRKTSGGILDWGIFEDPKAAV